MGMTIEKAIRYYEDKNVVLTEEEALANTVAIETMKKYQKIENIVDAYITDNPREPMYDTEDYMQSIREVLEDATN